MNKVVIYPDESGGIHVIIPSPFSGLTVNQIAEKDVPIGVEYSIVNDTSLPDYYIFRNAWVLNNGVITVDLTRAKNVSHGMRRKVRDYNFKPLDDIIAKQIPSYNFNDIESQRKLIREADAILQLNIDNAQNIEDLKVLIADLVRIFETI